MNHIPPYLFLSRADDDDIRELGKHDFCSVLVHPMLSNANHFTSLFCRELFRIFLKCVRHVWHAFPPLLIRPITFLACGAVIAFVDGTSTTAKTSPENVTSLSSVIIPRLFQVVCLENFFANLFEFNSYQRFGDYRKKKYKFVYVRLGRPHK